MSHFHFWGRGLTLVNPKLCSPSRAQGEFLDGSGQTAFVSNFRLHGGVGVLVLDAFTSDAVPVHLVTREAFAVYHRHLAPDGLLALNISTTHFELQPLVTALAESVQMQAVMVVSAPDRRRGQEACQWMLLASGDVTSRVPTLLDLETVQRREAIPPTADSAILRPTARRVHWTDSFSNPFAILAKKRR